jgi:hypothetical protein
MIMAEGTIGDRARPLHSFFVVLHWGGIDSDISGQAWEIPLLFVLLDFV